MSTTCLAENKSTTLTTCTTDPLGDVIAATVNTEMSDGDRNKFQKLNGIVAEGAAAFVRVGRALTQIRDERLYRGDYRTFEDYLAFHGLKRQRGYELIEAAKVADSLSEISDITIAKESHAAALKKVPAEYREEVLTHAYLTSDGNITAAAIESASNAVMRDVAKCVKGGEHDLANDADGWHCSKCHEDLHEDGSPLSDDELKNLNADDDEEDEDGDGSEIEDDGDEEGDRVDGEATEKRQSHDGKSRFLGDKEITKLKTQVRMLHKETCSAINRVDSIMRLIGDANGTLGDTRVTLSQALIGIQNNERSWSARRKGPMPHVAA